MITVKLEEDAAKAVERLRRERGIGFSEAVNELIRQGMVPRRHPGRFTQQTYPVGIKVDVSCIAEAPR